MTIVFESVRRLLDIPRRLDHIQMTLQQLEQTMSDFGTQFDQTLSDLGQAIDELATRISNLPATPAEVDQADLDALRASVSRIQGLAQAAPTIPIPGSTDEVPPVTDTPVEETPVDETSPDEVPDEDADESVSDK